MGQSRPGAIAPPASQTCPICKRPAALGVAPFCSRRCADADLSRWLRGAYAIPGGAADLDEDGDDSVAARGEVRSGERALGDGDEHG